MCSLWRPGQLRAGGGWSGGWTREAAGRLCNRQWVIELVFQGPVINSYKRHFVLLCPDPALRLLGSIGDSGRLSPRLI